MKKLNKNSWAIREAVELLKDKNVSDVQKLSLLQDWEWTLDDVIQLALMAADEEGE